MAGALRLYVGIMLCILSMGGALQAHAPLIVRNDNGGSVSMRYQALNELRMSGTVVQILGTCLSACTMYLGLPQTCVAPHSRLGFHGPHIGGKPQVDSVYAHLLALHYPKPLRDWYLTTGQYLEADEVQYVSGTELIEIGVPACS